MKLVQTDGDLTVYELNQEARDGIPARVAAGAEFLDDTDPGWWEALDLDRLDVGDWHRCVLGQRWDGGYTAAMHELELSLDQQVGLGFLAGSDDEADALTAGWRRCVNALRAERVPEPAGV